MGLPTGFIFLLATSFVHCLPRQRTGAVSNNIVGDGTQDIAVSILQEYAGSGENVVFSPVGYAALLAAAAEGASGMTRRQLEWALRLPDDRRLARSRYQAALRSLAGVGAKNEGLRSWLYVYKNFTVNDTYCQVLREYYLTEVKNVERLAEEPSLMTNDAMEMNKEKVDAMSNPVESGENIKGNDKAENASAAITEAPPMKEMGSTELAKEVMKKDTPQMVVTAVIKNVDEKDEVMKVPSKDIKVSSKDKVPADTSSNEASTSKNNASTPESSDLSEMAMPDTIGTTMKGARAAPDMKLGSVLEDSLRLDAMSEKNRIEEAIAEDEALYSGKDLMSGLSANNFVRKTTQNTSSPSQMLLFNGLYVRGRWAQPWRRVGKPQPFYKSGSAEVPVAMIRSAGSFRVANLTELDTIAVELPYEGGRFSLLVLVPLARDGLASLLSDLSVFPLAEVAALLQPQDVEVLLPAFSVQTVTKPQRALARLGVTHLFSREKADLSGISREAELFIEDLAQVTSIDVEESGVQPSGAIQTKQHVVADRPFAFFVRECKQDLLLLAGKLEDPLH